MRTESRNSNELVSKQWNSNVRQHLSLNYADVINWGRGRGERERRCVQLERELFEARRSRGEERQNRGMITVGRSDESRKRHHQKEDERAK